METKDIFIPVTKNPVPPDEVDLMRIVLLESIFKPDETGKMKQYQKVYYQTSFQGKPVSEGNNYVPSELVPYIFDAKNNAQVIDYAMQSFGFSIIHDVLLNNPDVFKNPYSAKLTEINNLPNPTIPNENQTQIQSTETTNTNAQQSTESGQQDGGEGTAPIVTPAN